MPFAEVAVNAGGPIRQTFTYRVPDGLHVEAGQAVYVPWGTRTLQGVVMDVTQVPAYADARDLETVIDPRPLLSPAHIQLARWMSDYHLAPLFDCVSLMLPRGFKQRPLTYFRATESAPVSGTSGLSENQRAVLDYLTNGEGTADEIRRATRLTGVPAAAAALVRAGLVERVYRLARPAARPKQVSMVRLAVGEGEARRRAAELREDGVPGALRRALVLEALADESEVPAPRARLLGMTAAVQRDLEGDRLVEVAEVTLVRDPLAGREWQYREPPALTDDQTRAADAIVRSLPDSGSQTFLLHGVTGSGKTEVYLAALDHAVRLGRRAIVLVPEIALTPQTIRRFGERFPGRVAVMHSALSLGEHFDMWYAVRDGKYDVVIGPRSALFAPQPDLALIVIDEEHEWTYKQQEGSPCYHARRAAEELARFSGAVLVLGSATPDVESHFKATEGSYRLLELPERLVRANASAALTAGSGVRAQPLPEVEVVDLREELKAGNRSIFSRSLRGAIQSALKADEQVILFLNRRGTASFLQCRDCGHVPGCRSCSVALTLHEPGEGRTPLRYTSGQAFAPTQMAALVCHYCRGQVPLPVECPQCGGARLRPMGLGTERVEEEARRALPGARTLRWDRDVTRARDSHEGILARFLAHEADILIGTQMVAKGLDIPQVTLVGVVSADTALRLPDFRAGERTFQLLEQVAGRAGRGPKGGRVIVQTYSPEHHAIQAAAGHDYHAMYQREIEFRGRLGYPPFGRLVRLTFAHTGEAYAQAQAAALVQRLRWKQAQEGIPNLDILGPAPAFAARIRGRWRWNIVLRGSDPTRILEGETLPRGWTVDVDPVSTA